MFWNYIIEDIDLANKLLEIETRKTIHYFICILVFIHDIKRMLGIDFRVLVLQLHMDNKLNFKVRLYRVFLIQVVVAQ